METGKRAVENIQGYMEYQYAGHGIKIKKMPFQTKGHFFKLHHLLNRNRKPL